MRVPFKHVLVSGAVAVAVLGGCGGHSATRIASRPPAPTMTTTTTLVPPGFGRWVDDINRAKWFAGLGKIAAAEKRREASVSQPRAGGAFLTPASRQPAPAVASPVNIGTATSASIASVMACIRRAESGDYGEHSHLGSGSGAYQFIPSTWRTWSARAGYSGYQYAYEAPPAVQDAVVAYTLTHGGAHNWDPSYGADSCTVGMP